MKQGLLEKLSQLAMKKILPMLPAAGAAIGTATGLPFGGMIGGAAGGLASSGINALLSGLSPQNQSHFQGLGINPQLYGLDLRQPQQQSAGLEALLQGTGNTLGNLAGNAFGYGVEQLIPQSESETIENLLRLLPPDVIKKFLDAQHF